MHTFKWDIYNSIQRIYPRIEPSPSQNYVCNFDFRKVEKYAARGHFVWCNTYEVLNKHFNTFRSRYNHKNQYWANVSFPCTREKFLKTHSERCYELHIRYEGYKTYNDNNKPTSFLTRNKLQRVLHMIYLWINNYDNFFALS